MEPCRGTFRRRGLRHDLREDVRVDVDLRRVGGVHRGLAVRRHRWLSGGTLLLDGDAPHRRVAFLDFAAARPSDVTRSSNPAKISTAQSTNTRTLAFR